ncbi:DUF1636 family protein [Notoacmeibacter marinus]|uniref:DUF1636 family protein n=1 Tax=Notoacmeibacter marinus TaxID=1876515 RepID=UPI001FE02DE9|nr:DUF1636 family protein [Notoacmeibacter marinus]
MTELRPSLDDSLMPMAGQRDVVVLVCSTCKKPDSADGDNSSGAMLADAAVQAIGAEPPVNRIKVQAVECLGNCKHGCSAAILSPGDWHYVFGNLDAGSAGDLLVGARLMGSVAEGPLPWRGRPASLKTGMIARIPPIAETGS